MGVARCEPAAPPCPSAPAAVRSPRSAGAMRRRPPAASRHAGARTHTRPQPARSGQRCLPALGTGSAAGDPRGPSCGAREQPGRSPPSLGTCQLPCGHGRGQGGSHLQVSRELLLLHQPGGSRNVASAGERCFAQLGRLLLRFLSHCKSRGCPSVPPPCQGAVPSHGSMPRTTQRVLTGRCWAGSDPPQLSAQALGGEGAGMLLCSCAGSVSSRRKSFVAGRVI